MSRHSLRWALRRKRKAPAPGAGTESRRFVPPAPGASRGGALECLVEPFMVANVGSSVDGVLDQVLVGRGDFVHKGQVIARLQSGFEHASVSLSEARFEFARRKVERNEVLFEKQLISEQDRDEMVTDARQLEEDMKKNKESLRLRTIGQPA